MIHFTFIEYGFTEEEFQMKTDEFLKKYKETNGDNFNSIQNKICNVFIPQIVKETLSGNLRWQPTRRMFMKLIDYKDDALLRIIAMEGLRDLAFADPLSGESARGIEYQREILMEKLTSYMTETDELYQTRETLSATMCAIYRHSHIGTIIDPKNVLLSGLEEIHKGISKHRVKTKVEFQAIDELALFACRKHSGLQFHSITGVCMNQTSLSKDVLSSVKNMNLMDALLLILNLANKVRIIGGIKASGKYKL